MCGICGFTHAQPKDAQVLKNMCDIMAHRGPDGEGAYLANGIALGHRRLSLIDLEGGYQPMVRKSNHHVSELISAGQALGTNKKPNDIPVVSQNGEYAIVFNGEIYNYRDLAAVLKAEGWVLKTTSDTEVLLTGYIAWGEKVLDRIRGMFAFAIWDEQKQILFCARDFFGIKPFYYTVQQEQFIFASEIKSILEHPAYERELNREALEQYLSFQFSALPETFFKGIYKLPPAHSMVVHPDGHIEMKQYWSPLFNEASEGCSLHEAAERVGEAMRESVHYHNVADVEVGSFMSSGIDSSYMAALLAQENPLVQTFTVGFSEYEGERDEISWAAELAEKLDVSNTNKYITQDEYWKALPYVQWHMDEPSGDPSAVALFFVDQIASKKVKAVLSGEGADELFGGYKIYQAPMATDRLGKLPKPLLRASAALLRKLGIRGANFLERASETVAEWYYTNANGVSFTVEERERILKNPVKAPDPLEVVSPDYQEAQDHDFDEPTQMQYVDIRNWLVGDILLKTDKMAMAHSLESRVPFLDKEVFAAASVLPLDMRVTPEQTKVALRKASLTAIPTDWAQKEKLGFPVPVAAWLREPANAQRVKTWFESPEAQLFFNKDELDRLLNEHLAGADRSRKIFIVWMFLMWYRMYFVERTSPYQAEETPTTYFPGNYLNNPNQSPTKTTE